MAEPQRQPDAGAEVRAAGGVIVAAGQGRERVCVIHRFAYDDWTLPKGKLEPDEGWEQAALREVLEETGYRCRLGDELEEISYLDRHGRTKHVRYWLMEKLDGEFAPNSEVDELRWLDSEEAEAALSYPHDKKLVRDALG